MIWKNSKTRTSLEFRISFLNTGNVALNPKVIVYFNEKAEKSLKSLRNYQILVIFNTALWLL